MSKQTAVQWLIDKLMDNGVGIHKAIREHALNLEERQKNAEWQEGNTWAYNNIKWCFQNGFKGISKEQMDEWYKQYILSKEGGDK